MLILKDKKAAKKIIKLAKKHPNWYTEEEVKYAKQVRWRIKQEQKQQKGGNLNAHLPCKT